MIWHVTIQLNSSCGLTKFGMCMTLSSDYLKKKALCCFTTCVLFNNWRLPLDAQKHRCFMSHCISVSDRSLTLILMLKWYISAKWKFPSPPCLQGNGVENDRLCAIILLKNKRSIHERGKSGFNDVRRFLRCGEVCFMGLGPESW